MGSCLRRMIHSHEIEVNGLDGHQARHWVGHQMLPYKPDARTGCFLTHTTPHLCICSKHMHGANTIL